MDNLQHIIDHIFQLGVIEGGILLLFLIAALWLLHFILMLKVWIFLAFMCIFLFTLPLF